MWYHPFLYTIYYTTPFCILYTIKGYNDFWQSVLILRFHLLNVSYCWHKQRVRWCTMTGESTVTLLNGDWFVKPPSYPKSECNWTQVQDPDSYWPIHWNSTQWRLGLKGVDIWPTMFHLRMVHPINHPITYVLCWAVYHFTFIYSRS